MLVEGVIKIYVIPYFLMFEFSTSTQRPLVLSSTELLKHNINRFHPENPARLVECINMIKEVSSLVDYNPPKALEDEEKYNLALSVIKSIHDINYVNMVKEYCERGQSTLSEWDTDTYICKDTFNQCILAQSAWLDGVDYVMKTSNMAFALSRPPGHHAMKSYSMGFCVFNYAVGAAYYAIEHFNISRVGIFDFDVVRYSFLNQNDTK